MTLLILAGGMGSRFGGLKQIEPVGPNGEFIIDYSIYDAKEAGFDKFVFIIKEENYASFKETVGKRFENIVDVEYVFQRNDDVPDFVPKIDRIKPWGTAHAIRAARNIVKGNFGIINADQLYGRDAFIKLANFLNSAKEHEFGTISYKLQTEKINEDGVKRGIIEEENGKLTKLTESLVTKQNGKYIATPLDGSLPFEVNNNTPISVNMFGFTPEIFPYLEQECIYFFMNNLNNLEKGEYLLPDVVESLRKQSLVSVSVIKTDESMLEVTYNSDKEIIVNHIKQAIEKGIYPQILK